jgi:pimeloyl-[acyl-carrier protein] methyl ester esterase
MKKLVFVHGWGSGDFVWDKMLPAFDGYECHIINLGFVGEEKIDMPQGDFIGIGHSLGGLWLLKHYGARMNGFVSIGSFNCFYKHIPAQILGKMKKNVIQDSARQLKDFWHHAGLDHPDGFKNINPVKLVEGLVSLSKWKANVPDIPVKILASRDDHIVPEKMTHDNWKNYDIEWRDDGGHMLPLTQPDWCIKHVKDFINALSD